MSKKILTLFIIFTFLVSSCNYKTTKQSNDNSNNATMVTQSKTPSPSNNGIQDNCSSKQNENQDINSEKPDKNKPANPNETNSKLSILSNKEKDWGIKPSSNHMTPEISSETQKLFKSYSAYYVGDTSSKVVYLTFDEGYENGYTSKILDILKANDVKAAFFVVKPYITSNKDLVKRMVDEGQLVCNHTWHHPSMPSKADNIDKFNMEFQETAKAFKDATGKDMPLYFRPPMGKYSEKSLYLTNKLGYKTILWSLAHADWDVKKQPGATKAHDIVMKRVHNGSIILLHAVSQSNTEALDSIIKDLKADGYRFGSLDELK